MSDMSDRELNPWGRKRFRKSSRSDSSGNGQCVAVATFNGEVAIGDTKSPVDDTYQKLHVTAEDFAAFIKGVSRP